MNHDEADADADGEESLRSRRRRITENRLTSVTAYLILNHSKILLVSPNTISTQVTSQTLAFALTGKSRDYEIIRKGLM
jgi:hypothetical protein